MDALSPDALPAPLPQPAEQILAQCRREVPPGRPWRTEQLLAVVVGAHPRAEVGDRPLAAWLARIVAERLAARGERELLPLVVTDLWYLSDRLLMHRPAIAIGEPGLNAATAHHAVRLPQLLVVEDRLRIHLDPEYPRVRACMWGRGPEATEHAVRLFADRHLDGFLDAAETLAAAAA
jgi:hypothetical protein